MTAFDEAYRAHLTAVFRYAIKCVGRREIAEEITAESFIALYNSFDRIDPELLPGWLFTVVKNRATDFWRRNALERRYSAGLDPEPKVEASSNIQEWLDAAPTLKPAHRACLILRYVHGLERAAVSVELADGGLHRLASISAEPGFGFITLCPHCDQGEPEELIVPIGAVREIRIGQAEDEPRLGFAPPEESTTA